MKLGIDKILKWYAIVLTSILGVMVFSSHSRNEPVAVERPSGVDEDRLPQIIKGIDHNKKYTFAGEKVPVENSDVFERLDRELLVNSYWHSSTVLNIKSAHRYFPVIEKILAEQGVPDDFKYLAVAESNLRNETSPAGAKGVWQFLKSIGQHYGLEINNEVDERFHIEKATLAACKYLKEYNRKYGNWTLAAAAYNMGSTKLSRALNDQKAESYYDLNLSAETNRYLFRIIALKEILTHPEDYGFYIPENERYQPQKNIRVVEVDGPINNLGDFAKKNGISYRTLKVYNPWLLTHQLSNPHRKTYQIQLPE